MIRKFTLLQVILACCVRAAGLKAQTVVSTLAGDGTAGQVDGPAAQARFNLPYGIALDGSGNVYVADLGNQQIRKITAAGTVVTYAGNGIRGYFDSPIALFAQFNSPKGLAADASGNVYVTDSGNGSIRKISPAGQVSTVAGDGNQGYVDGPAAFARFSGPAGVAVGDEKALYVADVGNYRIRKIDSLGNVTTVAGGTPRAYVDGPAAIARFLEPTGIVRDAAGNLLVADRAAHAVRLVSPTGTVSTLAGTGSAGYQDGPIAVARFTSPIGLALDAAGNIYVAERDGYRIRRISPAGLVSTVAGAGPPAGFADGPALTARFNGPFGLAYNPSTRELTVSDIGNNRIRRISGLPLRVLPAETGLMRLEAVPNPASGYLEVRCAASSQTPPPLELLDALGRVVAVAGGQFKGSYYAWNLNVAMLQSGIYFCRVVIDHHTLVHRVAVMH